MVCPPFPFSAPLSPPLTPSTSTPPPLPPLHSNSKACLCNLHNCIAPTLGLTMDQHRTCLDLVPMPRAAVCIPFLHLSYLPDPFSLTIMGNYVTNRDACVTCHTRHTSVTDFRPKSGNPVEVTLVTSPKLYIVSHAKGTDFP